MSRLPAGVVVGLRHKCSIRPVGALDSREGVKQMLKIYMYALSRLDEVRDREEGQAMIEYALLAALISVVAVVTLQAIGVPLIATFQKVVDGLSAGGGT